MTFSSARVRHLLHERQFETMFVEDLGWDRHHDSFAVAVDGHNYAIEAVAHKRGVQVLQCGPGPDGAIPPLATRQKIERQVTRHVYEHLIIFEDAARTRQRWQWVRRHPGEPSRPREMVVDAGQSGDELVQILGKIRFTLSDEESLDLAGVTHRLRAFDRDKVTKRFYESFKVEHGQFLAFITGIAETTDREWYASLMLNRLMFVYFIQQKRFLADDPNYLENRLQSVQDQRGRDKFHSFYRYFLRRLFHEGFGQQPERRQRDLDTLLGDVPYLNGGLFEQHTLEERYPDIDIPDEAFQRLFAFFGQWRWYLDDRPLADDSEINPDVLGYIFEKYINQKEMGAYYTKEDVTGYICTSTIIPHLFDVARRECAIAFVPGSAMWRLLSDDPARYIHEPVRRGVIRPDGSVLPESDLPDFVQTGMHDPNARMFDRRYNLAEANLRDAEDRKLTLPTETWREYVVRRQRCLELLRKLGEGEVHEINDMVTLNLDLRQFAQDAIANCEGPELLRAFWKALTTMTILDPTCGSGAFLFAALTILAALYDACLDRMQAFVDELDQSGERHSPAKFADFRKTLAEVDRHPNRDYYILKSIIVHNLYGVDIMEEAVEICKLRLFLKLVSQVERARDLEPLPDIDFNIRAGNTLVGFVTVDEVRRAAEQVPVVGKHGSASQSRMLDADTDAIIRRIEEDAEIVERAFTKFHEMQTERGVDAAEFQVSKQDLRSRLRILAAQLDQYLGREYGVDTADSAAFERWRVSHQPFHWFAEFYGIMRDGGFGVIVGNPPWIEYAKVRAEYTVRDYETESCGNLHCLCTERSLSIRGRDGRLSFIVQLPMMSSSRMRPVRDLLIRSSGYLQLLPFGDRPGKLFEGLQNCRSVVFLSSSPTKSMARRIVTARYQRWSTKIRIHLFSLICPVTSPDQPIIDGVIPKNADDLETSAFMKALSRGAKRLGGYILSRSRPIVVFYQEATQYWVKATIGLPYYAKNGRIGAPAHGRYLYFDRLDPAAIIDAIINSSLFYVYFVAYGDCFHLSDKLVSQFPVDPEIISDRQLATLAGRLNADLSAQAARKSIVTKSGDRIEYDEFYGGRSKHIIDDIDRLLATHYGFTDEELDFIVNYDIKYRMGQDALAAASDGDG